MAFDFDVVVRTIPNPSGKTVAFANLIIDQQIEVSGFKIIDGSKGLFVAPPNHKSNKTDDDGKPVYFDDVRFVGHRDEGQYKTELQEQIYTVMINKYNEVSATSNRGRTAAAQATSGNGSVAGQAKQLW